MNHNPRPMSMRKTVQLMVIVTILAWATQTLFAQWGYGGLILPERAAAKSESKPAAIELRERAAASGEGEVTLREVCRWSQQDGALLDPVGDMVLGHITTTQNFRQISVSDIRQKLSDAGINLTSVRFTGAATCAVTLGDVKVTPQVVDAPEQLQPVIVAEETPATQPIAEAPVVFFEDQLVLTRPLSREQGIIASDIKARRVQIDQPTTRAAMVVEDLIGLVAARDLKAGDIFDAADVKSPPAITAGQFMTVSMTIGGSEVETVARALDNATRGQVVRAKNEASGEIWRVVITGPNIGRLETDPNVVAVSPEP